ncbi:hydantoinase B/oxoprolinase family protein [Dactylosporangium darangshiense]|uniref:Hydantoinase B/oxoprolinase family protein n=1 Tax=Dactylosporangium darangshiense TaxID=579108 RepID=A0ABP8DUH0_9ACTN
MTADTAVAWDGVVRGYVPREPLDIDPGLALHETDTAAVDPVTFEVIRYALLNANVEHGQTLQRLCVSPVTMLTRDFQPSILTQRGELVFLGPYLQYFSNAQSLTVKWILEHRSADPGIAPGDMFLSNDPYVGTPHQPDTIVAAPVFFAGQLFCWVANVLHHSDIGGSVVGSFCVDAADIFTDPPAFPPFKIVEGGRLRPDMEQVFLRQSRLPGVVQMDLRAAVSANTAAVRKIEALIARYGADAVKTVMTKVLDAGEAVFRERLRQIPDGTWSHRLYAEASHTGDTGLYRYQLTVHKRGDELFVDNAGTDPQAGSINVTYAGLVGAFLSALTASLTPDLAGAYGGVYRRVHFDPVPGTLSCADFPAAVSPSGVFTMELLISLSGSVIAKMVAAGPTELRDQALGPAQPHWYGTIIAGQFASGAPYIAVNANNMIGALPASSDADGSDFGGHFWIPEGIASNIEETEQLYPMLCLYRRALRCGADGAGAHRGGRSITEAYVPWGTPGMAAALYIDDSFPKAVGPFGANPSSMGRVLVKHGVGLAQQFAAGVVPQDLDGLPGQEQPVDHKGPPVMLGADSVIAWTGANNPGYGDPLTREPHAVDEDVRHGRLGHADATRVYGVVWTAGGQVDPAATGRLRERRLRERLDTARRPAGGLPRIAEPGIRLRPVGGDLGVTLPDDRAAQWVSLSGRALLGPVTADYRTACAVRETPVNDLEPEFATHPGRPGAEILLREYLCPVSGLRLTTELIRAGDEPVPDMTLAGDAP